MLRFLCLGLVTLGASTPAIPNVSALRRLTLRECAHHHEDCSKLGGRCCTEGEKCYRKDQHWASCRPDCTPGIHEHDPPSHRTPWSCHLITPATGDSGIPHIKHVNGEVVNLQEGWHHGLKGTHFWDCEAGDCDSSLMRPFRREGAVYAPANAPVDPVHFGGSVYGEHLWMTGAASDALSRWLGPNVYGHDHYAGNVGGCGQCLLVRNHAADNSHWLALVMKKVRCHPDNPLCSGHQMTMDFAVPGFDHLSYSLANRCGQGWSHDTFISREQSGICGSVSPRHCHCESIPDHSEELKLMRWGCHLFRTWGWHHGVPTLDFKRVPCPKRMVDRFSGPGGFGPNGVIRAYEALAPVAQAVAPVKVLAPVKALVACAALSAASLLVVWRGCAGRRRGELLSTEPSLE
mmetsp:Transcript_43934/g.101531  ORF Transcript_43934/g.101531 Transcript_43934/m.101531 type:complete len:404 (+) Transcript_43934:68-1279(+)